MLLRRRFVYYEENSIQLEAGTIVALALFFWLEASVLRHALGHQTLLYFFAVLGLSVAAFALYAHVAISLASRLVVDLVVPGDESTMNQPRFGPVDALERSEDYEGALLEYLVLARIYPRNFEVLRRTGRIQELLENHTEAVTWYHRARKRAASSQEALTVTNRLCAIYDGALDEPASADEVLARFLEDYPDSPDRNLVIERLERRATKSERSISAILQALEESPLAESAEGDDVGGFDESVSLPAIGRKLKKPKPVLVALDDVGASESTIPAPAADDQDAPAAQKTTPGGSGGPQRVPLETMEAAAPDGAEQNAKGKDKKASLDKTAPAKRAKSVGTNGVSKRGKSTLEPLETISPADTTVSESQDAPQKRSGISLEAMEVDDP